MVKLGLPLGTAAALRAALLVASGAMPSRGFAAPAAATAAAAQPPGVTLSLRDVPAPDRAADAVRRQRPPARGRAGGAELSDHSGYP